MHSESRSGRCSYRNASLPCRGLAHDSRENRGIVVQNKGWPVRQSLNSRSFYVILRFDWKALIVTRCFELGIAVAGIHEHLLCDTVDSSQTRI